MADSADFESGIFANDAHRQNAFRVSFSFIDRGAADRRCRTWRMRNRGRHVGEVSGCLRLGGPAGGSRTAIRRWRVAPMGDRHLGFPGCHLWNIFERGQWRDLHHASRVRTRDGNDQTEVGHNERNELGQGRRPAVGLLRKQQALQVARANGGEILDALSVRQGGQSQSGRAHARPGGVPTTALPPCNEGKVWWARREERLCSPYEAKHDGVKLDRDSSPRHCEQLSCPPKPAFGRRRMRRQRPPKLAE
jgi:hypothetical protein